MRPICAALLLAASWASCVFAADGYPTRPVRMINPWAAGGPADFVGRLYAQHLTDLWGKQVVTDNRAGASGIIGTELAARATHEGVTMSDVENEMDVLQRKLVTKTREIEYGGFRARGSWRGIA